MTQGDDGRQIGKGGCLGLILLSILFAVVVFGSIIYVYRHNATPANRANEQQAIDQCLARVNAPETSPADRQALMENCQEMQKQFLKKYPDAAR